MIYSYYWAAYKIDLFKSLIKTLPHIINVFTDCIFTLKVENNLKV